MAERVKSRSRLQCAGVIEAIERAYDAVWRRLYAHVKPDNTQAEELKIELSRTLVALASDGVTDPRELRRKGLERMALSVL